MPNEVIKEVIIIPQVKSESVKVKLESVEVKS